MSHVRLTHSTRPTLEFHQAGQDEYSREAVASIAAELGTDRPPLVHTETREGNRAIRGTVSAPRRAAADPDTSDWQQSLANYVAELEAHVDEFQGDGYTLEDDQLGISKSAVLERVEWSMTPGKIYEFDYDVGVIVGRGTFESATITIDAPTVDTSMDTMLRIDGEGLPGFRDYRVEKALGQETRAVFDRDSAENNDVIINEGARRSVVFEGLITGTVEERRSKDIAIGSLTSNKSEITLETRFPGYAIDGFVTGYTSTFEGQRGNNSHRYRFEFIEGRRA